MLSRSRRFRTTHPVVLASRLATAALAFALVLRAVAAGVRGPTADSPAALSVALAAARSRREGRRGPRPQAGAAARARGAGGSGPPGSRWPWPSAAG